MSDPAAVTGFYGRWAGVYDVIARHTPGIRSLRSRTADALDLAPGETVVEMGCGTGANFPYLRERVGATGRVVGLDLTAGMLDRARDRVGAEGWENVHVLRGDAIRAPIEGTVDAVLATFVVGMLDDPGGAVRAWCDRLAQGGRVGLLDATRSPHPLATPANAVFRGFVAATSPPGTRGRYGESPAVVLDRRVEAARAALDDRGEVVLDDRAAGGFLRLTAGEVHP